MSSFPRNWQRKRLREKPDYEPRDRPHRMHADDIGYDVLHPTRGWQRFSAVRVMAGLKMAALLNPRRNA